MVVFHFGLTGSYPLWLFVTGRHKKRPQQGTKRCSCHPPAKRHVRRVCEFTYLVPLFSVSMSTSKQAELLLCGFCVGGFLPTSTPGSQAGRDFNHDSKAELTIWMKSGLWNGCPNSKSQSGHFCTLRCLSTLNRRNKEKTLLSFLGGRVRNSCISLRLHMIRASCILLPFYGPPRNFHFPPFFRFKERKCVGTFRRRGL